MTQIAEAIMIPIGAIAVEDGFNPRTEEGFDVKSIEELSKSIKQRGLLSPLAVRKDPDKDDHYLVIAGERRLRACQGVLEQIPCIVVNSRSDDGGERLVDSLIENIQREDISVADEVRAYGRLKDDHGWKSARIALETGMPQNRVTKRMQLLALPNDAIDAAAALPDRARKALVTIAGTAPDIAGELAKYQVTQSDEAQQDFGKYPCEKLRGYKCVKDFALMAEGGRYDAADLELVGDAHVARTELTDTFTYYVTADKELLNDAEQLGGTVELPDGRLLLGWELICELAGRKMIARVKERAEERESYKSSSNEAYRDTGGASSRVVVNPETGEVIEDDDEKKRVRSERFKAELREREEAQAFNSALSVPLLDRGASTPLTAGTARMIAHLILQERGVDYVLKGFRYIHPNGRLEDDKRTVKFVKGAEAEQLLNDWIGAGKRAEDILGRTLVVVLAAKFADERAVARSNRGGREPSIYGDCDPVAKAFEEELDKHLKKVVPKALYEQIHERDMTVTVEPEDEDDDVEALAAGDPGPEQGSENAPAP